MRRSQIPKTWTFTSQHCPVALPGLGDRDHDLACQNMLIPLSALDSGQTLSGLDWYVEHKQRPNGLTAVGHINQAAVVLPVLVAVVVPLPWSLCPMVISCLWKKDSIIIIYQHVYQNGGSTT